MAASWDVQASIVYQFQSIEILQCEPMLILIELVAAGALEVVVEDISIPKCRL